MTTALFGIASAGAAVASQHPGSRLRFLPLVIALLAAAVGVREADRPTVALIYAFLAASAAAGLVVAWGAERRRRIKGSGIEVPRS
ncbi:MAG: hypothetical protein U0P45_08915 [Acidimicrobiales bacterium]